MSYKTLIIIDNTSELTTLNQEIIKQTLKYFVSHIDNDDKVAIAVTGEKAEYITDFDDSLNTQIKTVEDLSFTDINAPGSDVLMDVILDWSKGDLALRDILYISSRSIAINSEYSEEELLFEVNNKLYPIYTLACVQNENNGVIKSLNSLSRISGGVSVTTEDAKEDADVEKQLSEMLLEAMKEQRKREAEKYESKSDEDVYMDAEEEFGTKNDFDSQNVELQDVNLQAKDTDSHRNNLAMEEDDEEMDYESEENIIYESSESEPFINELSKVRTPVVSCMIVIVLATIFIVIRNKKRKREEEHYLKSINDKESNQISSKRPFENEFGKEYGRISENIFEKETVCLSNDSDDSDTGTRILYQAKEGIEITLEDRSNPTKYFRACVRDTIVIGRSEKFCDIVISYDDSISSRHCEMFLRDNSIYLRDLSSSNGTMVNQQKVYQELKIESGDILRIGRLSFIIQIVEGNYE